MSVAEAALLARAEELNAWEVELKVRHDETAARVVHLKQLTKVNAFPQTAAGEELIAELGDANQRSEVLTAERDDLSTALTELREEFQSARDELVARQELEVEIEVRGDGELQQLQRSLSDLTDELDQVQTQLSVRDEDVAELQQKLL